MVHQEGFIQTISTGVVSSASKHDGSSPLVCLGLGRGARWGEGQTHETTGFQGATLRLGSRSMPCCGISMWKHRGTSWHKEFSRECAIMYSTWLLSSRSVSFPNPSLNTLRT